MPLNPWINKSRYVSICKYITRSLCSRVVGIIFESQEQLTLVLLLMGGMCNLLQCQTVRDCRIVHSSRLGSLETWVLVSRPVFTSLGLGLGLGTSESWFWSWSWNPQVSVLVLEPQSLGLGISLGTLESRSRSWSCDLRPWRLGFRHSWSVKLSAFHLCSCGTDI